MAVGLGVLAAGAVIAPAVAWATHQAGVTYTGTASNAGVAGTVTGTVEIDVSADGSSVTRFAVIDGTFPSWQFNDPSCAGKAFSYTWTGSIPITEPPGYPPGFHFFDTSPDPAPASKPFDFDGATDRPGTISGRFAYEEPDGTSCNTENIGWTASAPGGCAGSPEYLAQKAKVDGLQAKVDRLKAKIRKFKKTYRKLIAKEKFGAAKRVARKRGKANAKRRKLLGELIRARDMLEPMCATGPS